MKSMFLLQALLERVKIASMKKTAQGHLVTIRVSST